MTRRPVLVESAYGCRDTHIKRKGLVCIAATIGSPAAVEHDRLSGHVIIAENHDDSVCDFLGLAHAAKRNVARQIFAAAHHVGDIITERNKLLLGA